MDAAHRQPGASYEIQVQGELDAGWEMWFDGLAVTPVLPGQQPAATLLTGPVPDQAALRGLLCKLWDLNLPLIAVRRIEAGAGEESEHD